MVTGAGSGIGRAFAVEHAGRGGRGVCADVNTARAQATVAVISGAGGTALAVACDVSDEPRVRRLSDSPEDWLGDPASLMSRNAGIGAGGDVVGGTTTDYRHSTMSVDL
ncbi:MAG: SDR family NAD(P)-dependent oxidoreductase [Actinomycetota bacterium]|nr:SDR family NAD(P)-dependent oxidoreductase [Actinomycetota bacterium]